MPIVSVDFIFVTHIFSFDRLKDVIQCIKIDRHHCFKSGNIPKMWVAIFASTL